ncbi:hypothetical protein JL100_004120 [Skermanella mucosa]|uniref:hypothetical protein n=1 Tax=Skermanella mucosa TaxID=1789672 RepID=UPI00192B662F|nr:hypothetical protein [Skermanella mucosa]UEM21961.1 hypothetical protein JL100_004120 [Skermanella mucosa]
MKTNRAPAMAIPVMLGAIILGAAGPLAAQQSAPAVTATPNRQMQPSATGRTQASPAVPMAPSSGASTGTQLSLEQGRPSVTDRMGDDQREMELVQTSLLNRFGGMGFAEMRNFRKIGENYAAEVRTVEGVWVNVVIDPATGAVTVQQ